MAQKGWKINTISELASIKDRRTSSVNSFPATAPLGNLCLGLLLSFFSSGALTVAVFFSTVAARPPDDQPVGKEGTMFSRSAVFIGVWDVEEIVVERWEWYP